MAEIHESDHSKDTTEEFGEPPGGWVSAPQLTDTELLVTVLCKFTGKQLADGFCDDRFARTHPDVFCRAYYVQASALRDGRINLDGFDQIPPEVRLPLIGGEPSGGSRE